MHAASMRRAAACVLLAIVPAAPSAAAERPKVSIGYAYLIESVGDGGGSVPTGAFMSFALGRRSGLELDLGFHLDDDPDSHTFTGGLGRRFSLGERSPFVHAMGAVHHQRFGGDETRGPMFAGYSKTAFGGMAGAGYDLGTDASLDVRLGADFQMFFDDGKSFKTLRLVAGLTF